jgi:hypothetical protein
MWNLSIRTVNMREKHKMRFHDEIQKQGPEYPEILKNEQGDIKMSTREEERRIEKEANTKINQIK